MNSKQKIALHLLVAAIAVLAIVSPEHLGAMVGILVSLFVWTVNRKEKKGGKEE